MHGETNKQPPLAMSQECMRGWSSSTCTKLIPVNCHYFGVTVTLFDYCHLLLFCCYVTLDWNFHGLTKLLKYCITVVQPEIGGKRTMVM